MTSTNAFHEFEQQGWEEQVLGYDAWFEDVTGQVVKPLLDAVAVKKGESLLDLATGPGYVAIAAAERGAQVLGTDFAVAMVERARQRYPQLKFEVADAEKLQYPDRSFNCVVVNFGVPHFASPENCFKESWRVLKPGGRAAFSTWVQPMPGTVFGMIMAAVEKEGTMKVSSIPQGPPMFRLGDANNMKAALRDAGFVNPQVTSVHVVWRLTKPDSLIEAFLDGTVRTGALLKAQTPDALNRIRTALREAIEKHGVKGGQYEIPIPAVVGSGTKT